MDTDAIKAQNILLICGILSAVTFITGDLLEGTLLRGYNFITQSMSQLSAVGAPTRYLTLAFNILFVLLTIAFGLGVWEYSQILALRVSAVLMIGSAVLGVVMSVFFPPRLGESSLETVASTIGVGLGALGVIFVVAAIGFGAAAYPNWFRFFSISVLLLYALLTILRTSGILAAPAGQSLVGIQERTMMYVYMVWLLVLAVFLLQKDR